MHLLIVVHRGWQRVRINPLEPKLSALLLSKDMLFKLPPLLCMFLVMTVFDIWSSQHHIVP
jgi:hypothetical protein